MKKYWRKLIVLPLLLFAFYNLASFYAVYQMVHPARAPIEGSPSDWGLSFENVQFSPRNSKLKLKGWYIENDKESPAIIFVHGIFANRLSNNYTLEIAKGLHDRGFNVLLFDLRASGESEGEVFSSSYYERYDILGAFDFLTKEKNIPSGKVGVYGFSMGGATSVLALSGEPRIKGLILDSAFADANELVSQEIMHRIGSPIWVANLFMPMFRFYAKLVYGVDLSDMVPLEKVRNIKIPILLIHGLADKRVPYHDSVRIHKYSHKDSQLWLVPKASHTRSFAEDKQLYLNRVTKYFYKRLD